MTRRTSPTRTKRWSNDPAPYSPFLDGHLPAGEFRQPQEGYDEKLNPLVTEVWDYAFCPECAQQIEVRPTGRPKTYCSPTCRQRARRARLI